MLNVIVVLSSPFLSFPSSVSVVFDNQDSESLKRVRKQENDDQDRDVKQADLISEELIWIAQQHGLIPGVHRDDNGQTLLLLTGNTDPYRSDISRLGGKWREEVKGWSFLPHLIPDAFAFLANRTVIQPSAGKPRKSV